MMEYAQYQQQPPQGHHPQNQSHMQNPYPNPGQPPGPGAPLTSPTNQPLHQQHSLQNQTSPILPPHQQNAQNQGHPIHQQMYGQPTSSYGVQPQTMHYSMPGIGAAAMAATAAASGQSYPSTMQPSDYGLPQTSPRMGSGMALKKETGRPGPRSPQQLNNQMQHQLPGVAQQRRPSQQIGSPVLTNNHALLNQTMAKPQMQPPMPQAPPVQHVPEPELVTGQQEDSPLYVNAKQFHRILKRRVARQRLEEALRLTSKGRKPYLHESRHNHAMRRPRGPGGRFLTADEVAEIERKAAEGGGDENADVHATPAKANNAAPAPGSGNKRKAERDDDETPSKKIKHAASTDEDDADDGWVR